MPKARTKVIFKFGQKTYHVNPYIHDLRKTNVFGIPRLTVKDGKRYDRMTKRGRFAKGRDAWDMEMRSMDDFDKYKK